MGLGPRPMGPLARAKKNGAASGGQVVRVSAIFLLAWAHGFGPGPQAHVVYILIVSYIISYIYKLIIGLYIILLYYIWG